MRGEPSISMPKLLTALGMRLPIIADLGDGWFVVGHPNAAAIATENSLTPLEEAVGSDPRKLSESGNIPFEVREAALEAYTKWTWPLVKGHLDFTNWNPDGKELGQPTTD